MTSIPHTHSTSPADVPPPGELVDERLVLWHMVAAMIFFGVALLAGFMVSLQFLQRYPLPGLEIFSPGRWRMVHTNGVAYGFLANAFLSGLYWAVPRLTLRPVFNRKLSWFIFWAWQAVVGATAVGLVLGQAQALEWGETPVWIDPVALVGLVLVAVNFLAPIMRTSGPMYVTSWYFISAMVWTVLVYAMGNFLPQYFVGGTAAGAIGGLFIHDLVGLFVTPLGWGLMYYFVPIILRKPMWSHGLSLVGFWGLAFFYPLTGIHHFLYSPIPMFLQHGAIITTIAIELVVTTVIVNFFMTLAGRGDALRTSMPIRWFYTGMVFYFTTCLQCAFQTTLPFQRIIHFSDWVVGHAHLVMFGVFGFWLLGIMVHLFPRLVGAKGWYSDRLNSWQYWLTALGTLVMFLDLLVAGLVQGFLWRDLAPWEQSLIASMPFWFLRSVSGMAILIGSFLFFWNVWMTWRTRPAASASPAALGLRPATA